MKRFRYKAPFTLESGEVLPELEIAYTASGNLHPDKSNIVWVFHALTANADVFDWWNGLFGGDSFFNPEKYFIVCANILGSCYGTTGPLSENPGTGKPYYHSFPKITVRDMVRAHELLREYLAIEKIHVAIGGSLGGQQALEWAIEKPGLFENLILIATNARHSPWGIAFNEAQRLSIEADDSWKENHGRAGMNGMKAARATALLSYRNYSAYHLSQLETSDEKLDDFNASSYQKYQGEKLAKRFNAFSYYTLSKAMDSHQVARGRGGMKNALKRIKANTQVIGISSDFLFPTSEQRFLFRHLPHARYEEIHSDYGHDGFLVETEALTRTIQRFLHPVKRSNKIVFV